MYGKLIFLFFLSLLILINGQPGDNRNPPSGRPIAGRMAKLSFDTQFPQGRCPSQFYQSGDECLYFSPDGKIYSSRQAQRECARRIARMLVDPSSPNLNQPNMQPTKGVRQLVLNTPEKTEILRALNREYNEQNFALRLPNDYSTLQRCNDGQDDKWPQFCDQSSSTNTTCLEATTYGVSDICLREVECIAKFSRLACEFTLPGSPELTNSKFRTCANISGRRRGLARWAWIAIIVGSALLLLVILGGIFAFIRKSKKTGSSKIKKTVAEPRYKEDKPLRDLSKREDPAARPMLTAIRPTTEPDTNYLSAQELPKDNTANA